MKTVCYILSIVVVACLLTACNREGIEQEKLVGKWKLKEISYDIVTSDPATTLLIEENLKLQNRQQIGNTIEFTPKGTYKDDWGDEMSYSLRSNSINFTPPAMVSKVYLPVKYVAVDDLLTLYLDYYGNYEQIALEHMGVDFSRVTVEKVIILYSYVRE